MKFSKALDLTLKEFKIPAKDLANKSGVAESSISRYRRGERDIQADSLERLIASLPPEAQQYFYFNCVVPVLDDRGIATLLEAVSTKLRSGASENSRLPENLAALT
jgi:transcriptional regulator with XRE-family HTH domain